MDSPLFGSPSSPVKSPSEANRDVIVRSVLQFVDPQVAAVLRTTSLGYETSVARAEADRALDKRRVEELIGEALPDAPRHNWAVTRELADFSPFELLYTGNDIDSLVARKLGWEKLDVSTSGNLAAAREMLHREVVASAELGNITSLKILLPHLAPITEEMYKDIIMGAFIHSQQAVLEIPEIFAQLRVYDEDDIEGLLDTGMDENVSPNVLDFVLSSVNLAIGNFDYMWIVRRMITEGSFGFVLVMLKHNIFSPFEQTKINHGQSAWIPLNLAAEHGHAKIVRLFLEDPRLASVEELNYPPKKIILGGYADVFRLLMNCGKSNREENKDSDMLFAAGAGRLGIVQMMYEKYAEDEDVFNIHSLKEAVNNDHTDVALLILSSPVVHLSQRQKNDLIATARYFGNSVLERAIRLHD